MKRIISISVLAVISVFSFNSCKNDLKLNAPYKEIPSIYAVLNPQEQLQIIRINKVFLGEGNANTMAQVSDSVNYQAGDLTVTLERFVNGSKTVATPTGNKTEITFRDSTLQTATGAFSANQRVYVTSDKLFTSGQYVLTVYNNKTKNSFTAKANAIDSVKASGFRPFVPLYYPVPVGTAVNLDNYVDYSSAGTKYDIRYYSVKESKVFQLVMRLHYYDSLLTDPNNNNYKNYNYADYVFTNQFSKTTDGGELFVNSFRGQDITAAVANHMARSSKSVNDIIARKMYKIQFYVYSSTQDYADYLEYSAPSLSIAQEKPLYSNFDNRAALGIFTFRSRCTIVKEMDNSFISAFAYDKSTCKYKFYTAALGLPPCP